jgi:hypothetical protein
MLVGEGGEAEAGRLGGRARPAGRTALLLSEEQEELAQSLAAAKFPLLKNAPLERVKQLEPQRPGEGEQAVVVRRVAAGEQGRADSRPATSRTFRDMPDVYAKMPDVYSKMPENVYAGMPTDTFKDIPDDVFEEIPRAVTARARGRDLPRTGGLEKAEDYTASAPVEEAPPSQEHMGFIAMLFAGPSLPREESRQLEKDFMFALFIQKQEEDQQGNMSGSPGTRGEGRDPTVGHFCAPFCPGFCEANLCIFHTSN